MTTHTHPDPIRIAVADSYNPLQPFKQPHIDITLDIARQIVALAGIPALEGERINAVERRIAALEAQMHDHAHVYTDDGWRLGTSGAPVCSKRGSDLSRAEPQSIRDNGPCVEPATDNAETASICPGIPDDLTNAIDASISDKNGDYHHSWNDMIEHIVADVRAGKWPGVYVGKPAPASGGDEAAVVNRIREEFEYVAKAGRGACINSAMLNVKPLTDIIADLRAELDFAKSDPAFSTRMHLANVLGMDPGVPNASELIDATTKLRADRDALAKRLAEAGAEADIQREEAQRMTVEAQNLAAQVEGLIGKDGRNYLSRVEAQRDRALADLAAEREKAKRYDVHLAPKHDDKCEALADIRAGFDSIRDCACFVPRSEVAALKADLAAERAAREKAEREWKATGDAFVEKREQKQALHNELTAAQAKLAKAVGGIRRVTTQSRNGVTKCTVVGPDTLADLDAMLAEIGGGT